MDVSPVRNETRSQKQTETTQPAHTEFETMMRRIAHLFREAVKEEQKPRS